MHVSSLQGYSDAATGLRVSVVALDTANQLATVAFDGYTPYCNSDLPAVTLGATISTVTSATCDASQILAFEVRAAAMGDKIGLGNSLHTILVHAPRSFSHVSVTPSTAFRMCNCCATPRWKRTGVDVESCIGLRETSDAAVPDVVVAKRMGPSHVCAHFSSRCVDVDMLVIAHFVHDVAVG